jgi:hypothetical protein
VLGVAVRPTPHEGAEALAGELGDPAVLADSPFVLAGPVEHIHEQLLRTREELGISYFTVSQRHAEQLAPLMARLKSRP